MNAKQEIVKEVIDVAIQGGYGSFHEIAARKFFNDIKINIVPCDTFNDLFDELKDKKADCAMMAIENSVAGSLLPNYTMLRESKLNVCGEVYLRIEQNLIALPGQKLEDIKEIHSHPIAIQQSMGFLNPLRKKGVKVIESDDTALSAKWIHDEQLKGFAAIAGKLAAEMYHLEIIKENVETNHRNFTRFLLITDNSKVLELEQISNQKINKSSLCFKVSHDEGSLSQVLSVLAFYKMNLTKIQSLPIVGIEWEYQFYIDLMFDEYSRYKLALGAIEPLTKELEILGEYQNGQRPTENKIG